MTDDFATGAPPPRFDFPVPPAPKRTGGLWDEVLRQSAASLVRHALTALGAALAGLGWVAPEKFDSWAAAHSAELVGWLLIGLAQAWSWLHKRDVLELVRVALRMPSQQPTGVPTTVEHVRRKANDVRAQRRAMSLLLCLALVLPLPLAACGASDYEKAAHNFALWTNRLTGYCQSGLTITENLYDDHLINKETGATVVIAVRSINLANDKLVKEALKYVRVDPNTGQEVLALTEEGKLRVQDLALSLMSTANGLAQNPAFLNLTNEARNRLGRVLEAVQIAVATLFETVAKLKTLTPRNVRLTPQTLTLVRATATRQLDERKADVWASVP